MNILSLFDGMSCGQIASILAGFKIDKYYASEIDKYAIAVTQANYPETIQLGSVTNWREWDLPKIDLLIGGSPCQGFSFAGKRLAFDDPRSRLFFEYVNCLRHFRPKYFLLENVRMGKVHQDVISEYLGIEPICINSSLVSAQNRVRLYWCNWGVSQPKDKGLVLADILEDGFADRDKSHCLDANYFKGSSEDCYKKKNRRQIIYTGCAVRGRNTSPENTAQTLEFRLDGKANAITTVSKDSMVGIRVLSNGEGYPPTLVDNPEEKSYRKLTPEECERLQTVPVGYTDFVSTTRRYQMLGNGWTVDVIAHLLGEIAKGKPARPFQKQMVLL